MDQVVLNVTLRVVYDPNGMTSAELANLLDANLQRAIGNGMLSGDTPAEVDKWTANVTQECK
jgi:hypothetical protein